MDKPIVSLPVLLVGILVLAGPQAAVADGAPGNTLVGVWEVGIFPFQSLCGAQPRIGPPAPARGGGPAAAQRSAVDQLLTSVSTARSSSQQRATMATTPCPIPHPTTR